MIRQTSPRFGLSLGFLVLAACGQGQAPDIPPPAVSVEAVRAEAVPNIVELPGRIEAVRSAEVRARTTGIVERRLYTEGTDVAAGTPLFRIDPRDNQAQVEQTRAALQRAQAERTNAAAVVERYRPLVAERAISAQEYDSALAALRTAEANVADARASLSRAQLQLGYTVVRAPIAGRVGRAEVTEGALVSATSATLMTRVDQMSPIYAVFTQSNASLLDFMSQARQGELRVPNSLSRIEVRLILENGQEYGAIGHLDFADQSIDPTTGSQVLRAQFPNVGRVLLPGQFVRGRIEAGLIPNGITLPQRAVQISGERATVYVVGQNNVVSVRPVTLGRQIEGKWIIQSGLRAGERVVIDGWHKVQPGQAVRIAAPRPAAGSAAPARSGTAAAGSGAAAASPAAVSRSTN